MTYWPAVSDRLVELFTAAVPDRTVVFDGPRLNYNGGHDYITVGWDEDEDAGSLSFARSPLGNTFLAETGTVTCLVVAAAGADQKATRDRALALAQALAAAIAADQTLGVLPQGSESSVEIGVRARKDKGVLQALTLQVTYTTPF